MKRPSSTLPRAHGGFALLAVLLVLLALLVLTVPFLTTARNASQASSRFSDRVQNRLAMDSALRQARSELARSHPGVDLTPFWDDLEEVSVAARLDPEFVDRLDVGGVMWEVVAEDLSGRIDLNSAGPQLCANVIDGATRLTAPVDGQAKSLSVSSTYGFPEAGFLWVERELIGYTKLTPQAFEELQRGLLAGVDQPCGPQPASEHAAGAVVLDQRAFAPTLWRRNVPGGTPRRFEAPEHLRAAGEAALAPFEPADLEAFARCSTPYGDLRGGRRWQRAVRLMNDLQADESCVLRLDERRWFNPGTLVQIRGEGVSELGVVDSILGNGGLRLMDPVANDFTGFQAEVRALARRPVNINVAEADTLRLLFQNLQQRGVNERVTRGEAEALAELVLESRPFEGLEDFLRRVLLPAAGMEDLPANAPVVPDALAAGGSFIDPEDAVAIYANALNANDSRLLFSTLPFSFSSRELFALEARASVNAPSGIERVSAVREQTELIAPQTELLETWDTQEHFDEALRLDREAPWWASGPESTSQFDGGTVPPSQLWTQLGTWQGRVFLPGITPVPEDQASEEAPTPEHTFATRDPQGYARLWPARGEESGPRSGRMLHFDHETRDPEGRFLPDQNVQVLSSSDKVAWSDVSDELLRALSFSLWIKPQTLAPGVLLDVGASSLETDRVSLLVEDGDLVLRVFDGPGDNPATTEVEAGEVRFPLAAGEGPGLAVDTWTHVQVDVSGNRPDQMTMLVDGRSFGVRKPGSSALATSLTETTRQIQLEDGEGFPDRGVVRIGRELIEYVKSGADTLDATHDSDAGFGGRFARPPFSEGQPPATTYTLEVEGNHAAGTPVEVAGYSIPLASSVSSASGALQEDLGTFVVARLLSVEDSAGSDTTAIIESSLGLHLGHGLGPDTAVTGLLLGPLDGDDTVITDEELMAGFSRNGGYAAILQFKPDWIEDAFGNTVPETAYRGNKGEPLFGVEIIRYSGHNGTTLTMDSTGRAALAGIDQTRHSFVTSWASDVRPVAPANSTAQTGAVGKPLIVPISIPAAAGAGFPAPLPGRSEFAQITRDGADYALTEWVRYDTVAPGGHLARTDAVALQRLSNVITHEFAGLHLKQTIQTPGGGGTGGGVGGGGVKPGSSPLPLVMASTAGPAAPAASPQLGGAPELWQPVSGAHSDELLRWHVSRAAQSVFQFRGVAGTHVNEHPGGAVVLPVWRVDTGLEIDPDELPDGTPTLSSLAGWERDWDNGWPGRNDEVFLVDEDKTDPGFPATIHRAWQPRTHLRYDWIRPTGQTEIEPVDPPVLVAEDLQLIDPPYMLVALSEPLAVLVPASTPATSWVTADSVADTRLLSRLVKHPSGERPRVVQNVVVGGDLRGGGLPAVTVDELLFQTPELGLGTSFGYGIAGGQLVLASGLFPGSTDLIVRTDRMRTARGKQDMGPNFLSQLPEDAGLLQLGEEIVCYSEVDVSTGVLTIADGGRGLLGTEENRHEVGSVAQLLESLPVTVLTGAIGAGDDALPIADIDGFPSQGTVLVGTELIHYTRIRGAALEMPRASSVPGDMDGRGDGIFRGRFGTVPDAHAVGTPVILFPFRYWDREAERADGPELAYLGLALDQPNAYARSMFWEAEETDGTQIYVLQRASSAHREAPAWDGEPDGAGLRRFELGMPSREGNPLGVQADLFEWRIFARYLPGAFDELNGLSHGWKGTPRLNLFGVDYLAPNQVLRRVDR